MNRKNQKKILALWLLCVLLLGMTGWQYSYGTNKIQEMERVLAHAYRHQHHWQKAFPDSLWAAQTPKKLSEQWQKIHLKEQRLNIQLAESQLMQVQWKRKYELEVQNKALITAQNSQAMYLQQKKLDSLQFVWAAEKAMLLQAQHHLEARQKESNMDTITLTTGSGVHFHYFGKLKDGAPVGKGLAHYREKGWYYGEWLGKKRHGQGVHHYKDGDVYRGTFVMDAREGIGAYLYKDGSRYEGQWEKDKMHGRGTFWSADGKKWEGVWENGRRIDPAI